MYWLAVATADRQALVPLSTQVCMVSANPASLPPMLMLTSVVFALSGPS